MAFQPVPSTASFRLVHQYVDPGLLGNSELMCTFYIRNTVLGWPVARVSASGTTLGNGWRDQVMPLMSSNLTFDRVDGRDEGSEFGAQATVQYNTIGGDAGADSSLAVCPLLQLFGTTGGAPRRGRLFLPTISEGRTAGNAVVAATITSLLAAFAAIDASIVGGGDAWVIVSRFNNKVKRATAATNTIATRNIRPLLATQRDRRPGIGS